MSDLAHAPPEENDNFKEPPLPLITSCPHLGLRNDPTTAYGYPAQGNSCHRAQPPATINLDHQQAYCLVNNHPNCQVYQQDWSGPLPVDLQGHTFRTAGRSSRQKWIGLGLLGLVVLGLIGWWLFEPFSQSPENPSGLYIAPTVLQTLPSSPTASSTPTPVLQPVVVATATNTPSPTVTNSFSPISSPSTQLSPPAQTTPVLTIVGPTATSRASLTPTQSPTPLVQAVIIIENAIVRSGPGFEFPILYTATENETYSVVGRDIAGRWLQLCCWANDASGWVFRELLRLEGDLSTVPVIENSPELPSATPSQ